MLITTNHFSYPLTHRMHQNNTEKIGEIKVSNFQINTGNNDYSMNGILSPTVINTTTHEISENINDFFSKWFLLFLINL